MTHLAKPRSRSILLAACAALASLVWIAPPAAAAHVDPPIWRAVKSTDVAAATTDKATTTSTLGVSGIGVVTDADTTLEPFTPGVIEATTKQDDAPGTAADLSVNDVLLGLLPQPGEGWPFEETADGTRVELFTDVGGEGDDFTGTTLDDQYSRKPRAIQ